jgi:TRAP-type mannitol/chloroaromatic compound transport system permease small subunit
VSREPLPLRLLDAATQGFNVAGTALILGLMLLIGADVAGRNLAGAPVPGVPEMVSLSIVAIVFLQMPQALRQGRIARSEALLGALAARAPGVARAVETLFDLAGAAVLGGIVWTTWPILTAAWTRAQFVGAIGDLTIPIWPVKATIVLGGTLMAAQFLARIWRRHGGMA